MEEEGGEHDDRHRAEAVGGLRDRQIDSAGEGRIPVSDWAVVSTGLRLAALRSSDLAVPVLTIS